ncbi:hypothetical protein FXV91_15755 [Methanosarcina sp. DH2]|uniref:hypothetical protein n=1 Tax=Methanosarcina sp. DH2 TaxID=2605639 RepID=UPI001E4738A9|nr:hypothetical protein [Methanosarcina sp. DH2]MCC4771567.1 hypothetical protein [Methanosarcina sp. DH2]
MQNANPDINSNVNSDAKSNANSDTNSDANPGKKDEFKNKCTAGEKEKSVYRSIYYKLALY